MQWHDHVLKPLLAAVRQVRAWPYLGRSAFVTALVLMILAWTQGHHLDHPSDVPGYEVKNGVLVPLEGVAPAGTLLSRVSLILPYLDRWMVIGGMVYIFVMFRHWPDTRKMIFPTWVAAISVALWAVSSDLVQQLGTQQLTEMGEPPAFGAYVLKLVMLSMSALTLPVLLRFYTRCGTLDRYTMRVFLQPLVFCFIAFSSLWLIMDLLDNLKDFQEAKTPFGRVLSFYLGIIPFIFVSVMPASLLLAVLYSLTRMSRANEIVAMLGIGRSVVQILRPVLVIATAVALLSLAANYYWAPRAEGNREAVVRALGARQKGSIMASSVMYRDALTKRVWFVASFPFSLRQGREHLRGVQVHEVDAHGRISHAITAKSAMWWPGKIWRFYDGSEILYQDGKAMEIREFPRDASGAAVMEVRHFSETPWSMVSFDLVADYMSVPELVSYLKAHPRDPAEKLAPFRTHLMHRFALPWQTLALALVAAPLGISFSRRGSIGGIAGSIFIFFILLFLNNLCLNLGKGGHLPFWFSPWIPHLLFGGLGMVLLHYRSQNKDLPRLRPAFLTSRRTAIARPRRAAAVAS